MDIRLFFKKRPLPEDTMDSVVKKNKLQDLHTPQDTTGSCDEENVKNPSLSSKNGAQRSSAFEENKDLLALNVLSYDLGNYIESNSQIDLNDRRKYEFLLNPPNPPKSYNFKNDVSSGSRAFRYEWVVQYPWLVYSQRLRGALCLHCVLFKPTVKRGLQGAFITKAFVKYKDLHECARNHAKSEWHKEAVMKSKLFADVTSGKQTSVDTQVNDADRQLIQMNRNKIRPIISSIIFCGTHDLALRGKKSEEGIFPDLLNFRIESGDNILDDHFKTCSGKQKYTSHRIQNVIIDICGNLIRREIVQKINSEKTYGFSFLADESADISGIEQLSMGVRYLDKENKPSKLTEEFLGFIPLNKLDSENIASEILKFCATHRIDMQKLLGMGFDGCATMSGRINGVQKLIRNKFPKALYFHCASHRLNLVVNDLNAVREIQNTSGTVKEVIKFFRESTLRKHLIPNIPMLSDTRWSSKYKGIRLFAENFVEIKTVLDDLPLNSEINRSTRLKAQQLSSATSESTFIICLMIISKYSALLEPVTNILQGVSVDLLAVQKHVQNLLKMLRKHREEDLNVVFADIFKRCENAASEFGIQLKTPRVVKRQIHRANYDANSVEEYFKKSLYINYLDSLITSLNCRFSEENNPAFFLYKLHPAYMTALNENEFDNVVKQINDFYTIDNFYEEALAWFTYWKHEKDIVVTEETPIIELLQHCLFYPAVSKALEISLCLPPTTCTIERSFSTLRRVKTWLRSTMSENRLDGLCMMSIHREFINNDKATFLEKVISEFSKEPRNLRFAF